MAKAEAETAIACFERVHQVMVTVHDLDGRLRDYVGADRLSHRYDRCRAVKASGAGRCLAFDVDRVRLEAADHLAGSVRTCPYGIREVLVTCCRFGRLSWALFAGPVVADDDAEDLRESLRQLAARLQLWEDSHSEWPTGQRVERGGAGSPAGRRARILRWITVHHQEPVGLADLADELELSPAQASRVVTQACGRGFKDLLTAERIATAQALLNETDLPTTDIAIRAGFGDRSHFHRVFRSVTGMTPGAWRRQVPEV